MPTVRYYTNGIDNTNGYDERHLTDAQARVAGYAWVAVQSLGNIPFGGSTGVARHLLNTHGMGRGNPPRAYGANTVNRIVRDGVALAAEDTVLSDWEIIRRINANRSGRSRVSVNSSRTQVEQTGVRVTPRAGVRIRTASGQTHNIEISGDSTRFRTDGMRTIGIEIEINNINRAAFANGIRATGLPSSSSRYSNAFRANAGDVVPDSTVGQGGECRGPVVTLDKFQSVYRPVFQVARDLGGRATSNCGLHCHIGVRGSGLMTGAGELDHDALVRLVSFYKEHALALDRFTSSERRSDGNGNTWCRPLTDSDITTVRRGAHTAHSSVVNTGSIQTRGTVEYRQQRGTTDTRVAYGWAALMVALTDKANTDTLPELTGADGYATASALLGDNQNRLDAAMFLNEHRNGG